MQSLSPAVATPTKICKNGSFKHFYLFWFQILTSRRRWLKMILFCTSHQTRHFASRLNMTPFPPQAIKSLQVINLPLCRRCTCSSAVVSQLQLDDGSGTACRKPLVPAQGLRQKSLWPPGWQRDSCWPWWSEVSRGGRQGGIRLLLGLLLAMQRINSLHVPKSRNKTSLTQYLRNTFRSLPLQITGNWLLKKVLLLQPSASSFMSSY